MNARGLAASILPTLAVLAGLQGLPMFIPSPAQAGAAVLARPGQLGANLAATALTASKGFLIATAVTFGLAGLATAFQRVHAGVWGLGRALERLALRWNRPAELPL